MKGLVRDFDYPCEKYEGFDQCDSFIIHQNREKDMSRLLELGKEAYTTEIIEKRKLLEMLVECNGGRKNILFSGSQPVATFCCLGNTGTGVGMGGGAQMSPKAREKFAGTAFWEGSDKLWRGTRIAEESLTRLCGYLDRILCRNYTVYTFCNKKKWEWSQRR